MLLEFQILDHEWQWAEAARLSTLYWPEDPVNGERLQEYASEFPVDKFSLRAIARQGDGTVSYIRMMESFWFDDPGRCSIGIAIERGPGDDVVYNACLDHVHEVARENGMKTIYALMRSDDPHLIDILKKSGFKSGQVNPVSALDVESFELDPFTHAVNAVQEKGYRIVNLREYSEQAPDAWCAKLYDWEMTVMEDVPMPKPFVKMDYEVFEKMALSPNLSREGYILALAGDDIAACTQLNWNDVDRTIANTGVTGVLRDHRRQGLATALKALSIDWAKGVGIQRIYTDNEESNPMYQLNLAMGYRHVRDIVDYSKVIA